MKAISDVKMYKIIRKLLSKFTFGKYPDVTADTIFAVGNGTGNNDKSNAFEVKKDGTVILKKIVLGSDSCGDNLPEPGTPGRLFFLKAPRA